MSNIKILYEDNNILAVDKPAGLLVYSPKHFKEAEDALIDQVLSYLNLKKKSERAGVVHRLDRDTSGVILFAKNKEAETKLKKIFKDRKIKKYYTVLVKGRISPEKGIINIPLGRASKDRLRVVPSSSGKPSETLYRVINYFKREDLSLLEVELKTGRMHQIRVHFSAIGHPVLGDSSYGGKSEKINRQFLHASKIEFIDPFNDKNLKISSKIPKDLAGFFENLIRQNKK
ncbi:MAG: RluA family pseudouridine synthase [Patescibacteria group bacterium]|nr:RluA family pseudouridine synthase [Patescibacteria group bacterium]